MNNENQRLKRIYHNMITRCENKNSKFYKWYGENGISICDEWRKSFLVFAQWSHENGYTDDLTLERIDNSKGYSPNNCRWATRKEQANNRRSNRNITYKNKTQTVAMWAEETGITPSAIKQRLNNGWSIHDALTTPNLNTNKTRLITFNGQTKRMCDWAKELGISYSTLQNRINLHNWDIEKALTTKVKTK